MKAGKTLLHEAERAAYRLLRVLSQRGLNPEAVHDFILTQRQNRVWLFAVVDVTQVERLEGWTSEALLHHLRTALGGRPVVVSNSNGLRYAVLLRGRVGFPRKVLYPGSAKGLFRLGVNVHGREVRVPWADLGHVLVAGVTRYGKSNALRLLVRQALEQGHEVMAAEPDGSTFGAWQGVLKAYGEGPEGAVRVLSEAWALWGARGGKIRAAGVGTYEDFLAQGGKMPRLFVVVDEYNGMVTASGGLRGRLGQAAMQLAWQGRKYGVHLVLAGQEWTRAVIGPVRAQLSTRIVFRLENAMHSRMVLGRTGAERLRVPGRALTNWGVVQVYWTDDKPPKGQGFGLTPEEEELVRYLVEHHGGRMTRKALMAYGLGKREAERLRQEWRKRGLAALRPGQDNALCLVDEVVARVARAARVARLPQENHKEGMSHEARV